MTTQNIVAALASAIARVRPPAEEAAATQSGVATARYVEGITDEPGLRGELEALGYLGLRQDRLVLAAQLSQQLSLYRDRLAIWRQQYKDGVLDQAEYTTLLEGTGLPQENVLLELDRVAPQAPKVPLISATISLSVLSAEVAPERPVEVASTISLAVLACTPVVVEVVEVQPAVISLAILQATIMPAALEAAPSILFLDIIEVTEYVPVTVVQVPSVISLTVLEAEVVPLEVVVEASTVISLAVLEAEVVIPEVVALIPVEVSLLILAAEVI